MISNVPISVQFLTPRLSAQRFIIFSPTLRGRKHNQRNNENSPSGGRANRHGGQPINGRAILSSGIFPCRCIQARWKDDGGGNHTDQTEHEFEPFAGEGFHCFLSIGAAQRFL